MKDYVIPNGNENEFVIMAESLGFGELIFLYPSNKFDSVDLSGLQARTRMRISKAALVAKKDIAMMNRKAFTVAETNDDLRSTLETGPSMVFGCEEASEKDYLHHRGSGFNQVLAKIARDKHIIYGFSFSSILKADSVFRSKIIGRMSQNKMLFRKYKVKYIVASFAESPELMRAAEEMKAFERIL